MAQMRIKEYRVTQSQIVDFFLNVYWAETDRVVNPYDVINDLKEGKTWTYKGVPIKLKKLRK
jgi:hypothetical protein